MDSRDLGKNIRRLRIEAGIGLRQLSRMADISPASITAIEKGQSSPALATLQKVLAALGTNFAEFFSDSNEKINSPVFSPEDMHIVKDEHRQYTLLFPKRQDIKLTVMYETVAASEKQGHWETHTCDVAGFVLSGGPAELEIEGQGKWKLKKGCSFYVKANSKHRLNNVGKRLLKQITVMNPPGY